MLERVEVAVELLVVMCREEASRGEVKVLPGQPALRRGQRGFGSRVHQRVDDLRAKVQEGRLAEFRPRIRAPKSPGRRQLGSSARGGEFPSPFGPTSCALALSPFPHIPSPDTQNWTTRTPSSPTSDKRKSIPPLSSLLFECTPPNGPDLTPHPSIQRLGFRQPALLRLCQGRPRKAHRLCRGQSPSSQTSPPLSCPATRSPGTTLSGSMTVPQRSQ